MGGYNGLENFTFVRTRTQLQLDVPILSVYHVNRQRIACIEVPHLIRSNPVKRGEIFALQQKIDSRRRIPAAFESGPKSLSIKRQLSSIRFAVEATLRVRTQL